MHYIVACDSILFIWNCEFDERFTIIIIVFSILRRFYYEYFITRMKGNTPRMLSDSEGWFGPEASEGASKDLILLKETGFPKRLLFYMYYEIITYLPEKRAPGQNAEDIKDSDLYSVINRRSEFPLGRVISLSTLITRSVRYDK